MSSQQRWSPHTHTPRPGSTCPSQVPGLARPHILSTLHLACCSSTCRLWLTASRMIRSLRLWLAEVREISSTSTLRDDSFSKSKQTVRARKWAQRLSRGLSVRTIPDSPYSTWSYGHMMLTKSWATPEASIKCAPRNPHPHKKWGCQGGHGPCM